MPRDFIITSTKSEEQPEKYAALDIILIKQQIEEGTIGLKYTNIEASGKPTDQRHKYDPSGRFKKDQQIMPHPDPDNEVEEQRRGATKGPKRMMKESNAKTTTTSSFWDINV